MVLGQGCDQRMCGQQARILRLPGVCGEQPGRGAGTVPRCRTPGGPLPGAGGQQVGDREDRAE